MYTKGIAMRALLLCLALLLPHPAAAQPSAEGRKLFETRCGVCHGGDANGGEFAPGIVARVRAMSDPQIADLIHSGLPGRGMPPVAITTNELQAILAHLHTLP